MTNYKNKKIHKFIHSEGSLIDIECENAQKKKNSVVRS